MRGGGRIILGLGLGVTSRPQRPVSPSVGQAKISHHCRLFATTGKVRDVLRENSREAREVFWPHGGIGNVPGWDGCFINETDMYP